MYDENTPFRRGNSVLVIDESATGQIGQVIDILTIQTKSGRHELVWVKMAGGKVEGFSPRRLKKLFSTGRAA